VVSLSAAAPTTSLLVGELLQGGDYAGVKTTLRRLLTALVGAAGVFAVEPLLAGLQAPPPGSGGSPKAKVYPNTPT